MCEHRHDYSHQVPMPIRRRVEHIDRCIAPLVAALNAGGIETIGSCCGHGRLPGTVILANGRWLYIESGPRPEHLGQPKTTHTMVMTKGGPARVGICSICGKGPAPGCDGGAFDQCVNGHWWPAIPPPEHSGQGESDD